jgi:hypothetical protein
MLDEVSHSSRPSDRPKRLPPTSPDLMRDEVQPYFLWWLDCTVADLKRSLADPDPEKRAYFLGALLREANTRDVWLFTTPEQVHREWPRLVRHLGRARKMWAWLLGLPEPEWPPREARRAK